jgi:hypothetical protein
LGSVLTLELLRCRQRSPPGHAGCLLATLAAGSTTIPS